MRRFPIACIAVLATLSFSACPELTGPAQANDVDPCQGLEEWGLFVEGEPADDFVRRLRDNPEQLDMFLYRPPPVGLDIRRSPWNIEALTSLLERIDREPTSIIPEVPEALQGISGFISILVLKKLLIQVHPVVRGKIRDYIFDERTKSGHVSVDMCIDRNQFYHWDIEVLDGEYGVHFRIPADPQNPDYPDNPFPDVDLKLPAAATDPNDKRSVWFRNLEYKLHALGDRIQVRHIYYRGPTVPDLTRLDSQHKLYTATNASCIDLFTEDYPPATIGELRQKDYCLGRCEHPAIVNTGGG
jgi:hypothetical protein